MSYAYNGISCDTSSRILTSNHKFFSPNTPLYKKQVEWHLPFPETQQIVVKPPDKEDKAPDKEDKAHTPKCRSCRGV